MNISGGGINTAQRVMDCGDAGHILLSNRVAEDLKQLSRWANDLHDLGTVAVKHGELVHLYNLYNDEIGNPEIPQKLRRTETVAKPQFVLRWVVAAAVLVAIGLGLYLTRNLWKAAPAEKPPAIVSTPDPKPIFTYFLTPSDPDPNAEEKRFAGNEQFRNNSKFKFVVIPEQSGVLYLFNQGSGPNRTTAWNVLFPTPEKNKGSSAVLANQRMEVSIFFDRHSGDEDLQIVWASQPIPELETICRDAATTDFEIKNPAQIQSVIAFLTRHQSADTSSEIDNAKKHTIVRGRGDVITTKRVLEHIDY